MATQRQIKQWIPAAIDIFRKYIPMDDLPEIHIVSDRTLFKTRREIISRLGSHTHQVEPDDEDRYDSIMEMIHGEFGNAVLIRQEDVPDPREHRYAEVGFQRMFWHELGHFVAITSEKTNLNRFNDPGLADEREKQEGYWLWSEFVAEAIALYVDWKRCSIDNREYYHPDLLNWEPDLWSPVVGRLQNLLEMTFSAFTMTINEAALGTYFATFLMEDITKRYVQAAAEGKLKRYVGPNKHETIPPGEIDATCFDEYDPAYRDALMKMLHMLDKQTKRERFWEIDEDFLERLGTEVMRLMDTKLLLMAASFE